MVSMNVFPNLLVHLLENSASGSETSRQAIGDHTINDTLNSKEIKSA